MKQTGFADAMKKLKLTDGAGSDGKLPSSRYLDSDNGRQSDGAGCTKIYNNWVSFNSSGDKAVPSVEGDVNEKEVDATVNTLNELNTSPTLETDLDSCQKENGRQVSVTLTIVKIR